MNKYQALLDCLLAYLPMYPLADPIYDSIYASQSLLAQVVQQYQEGPAAMAREAVMGAYSGKKPEWLSRVGL